MPIHELVVTMTVRAPDTGRHFDVSLTVPANGAAGLALADPGKLKLGSIVEQLGTLVDEDLTAL